jgi:hypothetical protein
MDGIAFHAISSNSIGIGGGSIERQGGGRDNPYKYSIVGEVVLSSNSKGKETLKLISSPPSVLFRSFVSFSSSLLSYYDIILA